MCTYNIYTFCSFKEVLRNVTSSNKETIHFMQKHGILKSSVVCPGPCFKGSRSFGCGRQMLLKTTNDSKDSLMWRCRRLHKGSDSNRTYVTKDVKLTIRHESWLVDSKLPLTTVIEMIYLWSQAFSIKEIMHELKLSKKTVVEWTIFFRECCYTKMIIDSEPIGGPGIEVEIDESKFGKRKYYRGHRVEGQWVFGGREKYDKSKVFMIPVVNRKQSTLLPIIKKWIKEGSIIHSDCWKAYCRLPKMGYTHVTVNHSKEFVNKSNAACTNGIESDWRHAKVTLPRYGVHRGLHGAYLAEFMWRRKYNEADKFLQLINDINVTYQRNYMSSLPGCLKT